MDLKKLKLSLIKPYENNNKIHNDFQIEEIAKSITEYGYRSPILVDENNVIIAGHARFEALKKLWRKEVEVVVATGMSEEQIKKYRILDNRLWDFGSYDVDALKVELLSIGSDEMYDLFTGFDVKPDVEEIESWRIDDFARWEANEPRNTERSEEAMLRKFEMYFSDEEFVEMCDCLDQVCESEWHDSYSRAVLKIVTDYVNTRGASKNES